MTTYKEEEINAAAARKLTLAEILAQLEPAKYPQLRGRNCAAAAAPPGAPPVLPGAPGAPGTPPAGNTAVNQGLKSLTTFVRQLVGIGSLAYALKALIGGFTKMVKTSAEASFGLERFTRQTGISLEEAKRWEQIAAANGLKADEIQESLKSLQQNAQHIAMGEGGTNANRWGIDPLVALRNPAGVFKLFQDVTRGLSQAQAMVVAEAAGIDARVAQMLLRERDHPTGAIPGLAMTNDQLETVRGLGAAWAQLHVILSSLGDKITQDVAPALTRALDALTRAGAVFINDRLRKNLYDAPPGLLPFGLMPIGMAVRTIQVTNNVDVTMNGSGEGKKDGEAAAKAIDRMLSDAAYGRQSPYIIAPSPSAQ